MSEIQKHTQDDREFKKSTKIAAGIIGGLMVTSIVGGTIERSSREEERVHLITEEYEHGQDILGEINSRSKILFDSEKDDMVGYLPITEGETLYDTALSLIPESFKDNQFVQYTLLESAKSNGTYQSDDIFAITKEEIDGKETLLVRPIDSSAANTNIPVPSASDSKN